MAIADEERAVAHGRSTGAAYGAPRVITVSAGRYAVHAENLLASMAATNPRARVTVFCDDAGGLRHLRRYGCALVELPAIAALGPKRARFEVYADAVREGPFVYLDADTIVLDDLSEVFGLDEFAALSRRSLRVPVHRGSPLPLAWRSHAGSPYLHQRRCARGAHGDASRARGAASGGGVRRGVGALRHPGQAVRQPFPVRAAQPLGGRRTGAGPEVYNWQGLHRDGRLVARLGAGDVIESPGGKRVRILHFAGIGDPERFMLAAPPAFARAVGRVVSAGGPPRWLPLLSASVGEEEGDPAIELEHRHAYTALVRAAADCQRGAPAEEAAGRATHYCSDVEALRSVCYTVPSSRVRWNGLRCGGSYLEASAEYQQLRTLLRRLAPAHVLEVGAGETSRLMRRLDLDVLSLECQEGPWLDDARAEGCRVQLVAFDPARRAFDIDALRAALIALATDAPGSPLHRLASRNLANRRGVLGQVLALLRPRPNPVARRAPGCRARVRGAARGRLSRRGVLGLRSRNAAPRAREGAGCRRHRPAGRATSGCGPARPGSM